MVAGLRCIAEHCKFYSLESMLCDRLVCGIQDTRIQRRLLPEAKLEFKQAFELAKAVESADRDATTLINNSSTPAHTIPGQTPRQQQQPDVLLPKVTRHVIGVKENTPPKAVVLRMLSTETVKRKAISLVSA